MSTSINTAAYGQGPMPLVIAGTDAAGVVGRDSETVDVDNSVPTVSLSGPADAPSTAGTQFVTATAGGSPSGIDQIVCSVDGGPARAHAGAVARVPVSALGLHQVSCTAYNNAMDANGVHGVSQTQRWSIKIGTPTALDVTFARFAGLRCKLETRTTIPGLQRKLVRVTKCHLKRRKRVKHRKVVVPPHLKAKAEQLIGHGRATTVSGLLRLADGTALAAKTVEVLIAPDNGTGRFTPAAE